LTTIPELIKLTGDLANPILTGGKTGMNIRRNIFALIAVIMAFGLIFGCATKKETGALIGAGAGAAAGAGIGAAVGGGEGALIGGAIGAFGGALTGAVVGSFMDKHEAKMREKMGRRATIERVGDQLIVKFKSGILFDVNRYDLRAGSVQTLSDFSTVLKDFPQTTLKVEGHTDSTGAATYNQQLSLSRASSVSNFLNGQGVEKARLTAAGFGEERPVSNNATLQGRQQNRRVEVKITPIVKEE